jgi:hypothetical protein
MSSVQHSHKNETFHAKTVAGRSGDEVSKNLSVPLRSRRENLRS